MAQKIWSIERDGDKYTGYVNGLDIDIMDEREYHGYISVQVNSYDSTTGRVSLAQVIDTLIDIIAQCEVFAAIKGIILPKLDEVLEDIESFGDEGIIGFWEAQQDDCGWYFSTNA